MKIFGVFFLLASSTVIAAAPADPGIMTTAHAITQQPDGKLLIAAEAWDSGNSAFAVLRLNTDGSFDESFGARGKVVLLYGHKGDARYIRERASAVTVDADGTILVAGLTQASENLSGEKYDIVLARFTPEGKEAAQFGEQGRVIVPADVWAQNESASLQVLPDRKILLTSIASGYEARIYRFLPNGALDPSFGNQGVAVGPSNGLSNFAQDTRVAADGAIQVAGIGQYQFNEYHVPASDWLEVFGSDGVLRAVAPDTSKHDPVFPFTERQGAANVNDVKLQSDGKIVLAANVNASRFHDPNHWYDWNNEDFAVTRYLPDGTLDPAFGMQGRVETPFRDYPYPSDDRVDGLVLQADQKIVVGGSSDGALALVRYKTDGSLDSAFGDKGKVLTDIMQHRMRFLYVQRDGKIVSTGTTKVSEDGQPLSLVRLTAEGKVDGSFGNSGIVKLWLRLSDLPAGFPPRVHP